MRLDIWGVRGAIPTPGEGTNRYGGNTPCCSIRAEDGHLCIIDMGTGIVPLGMALMQGDHGDTSFAKGMGSATILLSHAHWDHIQGFPFFAPVFVPGNRFCVYGNASTAERVEAILEGQMNPQFSPIYTLRNLGASIDFQGVSEGQTFSVSGLTVAAHPLPHGDTTALGFRIEEDGNSIVYASDVGYGESGASPEHLAFFRNADVLIHDATYTPEEQKDRRERGYSTYLDAARVAAEANVKTLVLFHYDQDHHDAQVDQNVARCREELERLGSGVEVVGAYEGMSIEL